MTVYVLDADAWINLKDHYPQQFNSIRRAVRNGHVKIPGGVYREIVTASDRLAQNLQTYSHKYECLVEVKTPQLYSVLASIERKYGKRIKVGQREHGGLWTSIAGKKAADSQVVTVAKVGDWTVVSNDKKINLVCLLEGVPCITWTEFARKVLPPAQLSLFG